MSQPKVFEFAKEVGMTPLALMDKIREWQLPIKSHMAELTPDTLEALKAKLSESKAPAATEKKATATRKKAAAPAKPEPAIKAAVGKAAPAKAAATKTAAAATAAPAKAGAVVRRKKAEEVVVAAAPAKESASTPIEPVAQKLIEEKAIPQSAKQTQQPAVVAKETPVPVAETTGATASTSVTPSASAAPTVAMPRKKEVEIGNSGVASAQSAVQRKNIIGRMDLSRVSPPPGQGQRSDRPQQTGGYSPRPQVGGAGGARPKGNIRAGFVQQAPVIPPFMPSEDRRPMGGKDDKRRRSGPLGAGEGAPTTAKETEGQVQHFDAAEFRKREMVFQPKKKKGLLARPSLQTQITTKKASKRVIKVNQTIKVSDLANEMGVKATEIIKHLMKSGVMTNMNAVLDFETVALTVPDFGFEAVNSFKTAEEVLIDTAFGDLNAEKIIRPPVVTIMGHVDHGKTSLLDAIRNAKVAEGEAGGITQHIGAYQVTTADGSLITFLDTPGHEAFTAMRARGANVTDIAVIVVAADDGVMPQTAEAINHAKAAGVPLIVAINKMDKPGANPDKVKQQLMQYEVVPEELGGSTIFCPVSAFKKTGISELLEQIKLVAEIGQLEANPKRSATGTVIESRLEKGRGPTATVLIKDGTLKVGQDVVAGPVKGRIKSLINYKGERIQEAGPGTPVEIQGLESVPSAGDQFDAVKDEKTAEDVVQIRKDIILQKNSAPQKLTLDQIFSKVTQGDVKELLVILKTDVAGSLEAILGMFSKLVAAEVKIKVIHSAIGGITESDVLLASSAKGIIVGFNVRPDSSAQNEARRLGVDIRTYGIVYEMMDEMKKAMSGMLTPESFEKVMGRAEVRNIFSVPKLGTIAGCSVVDGKIQRSNMARLIRDGKVVFEGKIISLKRFKDDAKEVVAGFECGVGIENFNDVKVGDVIEAYVREERARELTLQTQP